MADDYFTKLGQFAQSAATRLQVKSALNPILWLCAIAIPLFLTGAFVFRAISFLCFTLVIFAAIPMLVACAAYIGFAIFKPEKLQSEDYQIRQQAIQLIAQKGKGFSVPSTALEAIANPAWRRIDRGPES